jgi:hypothetical protein
VSQFETSGANRTAPLGKIVKFQRSDAASAQIAADSLSTRISRIQSACSSLFAMMHSPVSAITARILLTWDLPARSGIYRGNTFDFRSARKFDQDRGFAAIATLKTIYRENFR